MDGISVINCIFRYLYGRILGNYYGIEDFIIIINLYYQYIK